MTDTATGVSIRSATAEDLDFVAWAKLTASRSHLRRGLWEYLYDAPEEVILTYGRQLASTETVHMNHVSLFLIAEVDGEPAAAMCAYDSATQGFAALAAVAPAVATACGLDVNDPDLGRRLGVMMSGFQHPEPPRAWTIENVATRPEFRRRGLSEILMREHLERGRSLGFDHASIGVYLENEPARAAYLKAGFEIISECRSDGWAAEIGCPGTELMLQKL